VTAHRHRAPIGRVAALIAIFAAAAVPAQPVTRSVFPPEEFAARRARVFERIGDSVALLEGSTERPGEQPFRQGNEFYYLTGVAEPRAIALLDGRSRETTLFLLPAHAPDVDSKFGPGALYPGEQSARLLGLAAVLSRDALPEMLAAIGKQGRTIFTPFRPEVLGSASAYDTQLLTRLNHEDPWDGRPSREEAFRLKLIEAAPKSEIRDLDPIVDDLRAIKTPREIAVLRTATQIADAGILRAMHAAHPGLIEYHLQAEAEYEFKRRGAYGPAYFALVATGKNSWYTHYHYDTATLQPGELVQFDYAPDYHYYSSDVTRIFPAGARFDAHQREVYTLYLRLYQALMTSIRVHETPETIARRAVAKMDEIVAAHAYTDPDLKQAVLAFVDGIRNRKPGFLGHAVGMEVHDVYGAYQTLEPGMVFTIEPMLRLPAEHVGLRLEDMLLITPEGYENLSAALPVEVDAIEKLKAGPLPAALR